MTKHVIPDAIPYIDAARAHANMLEVAIHNGPWDITPGPAIAAVSELESGDDPFGVGDSPDGAIGPMQVTPSGWEAGEWNKVSQPNERVFGASDLRDYQRNYDVGAFGLQRRRDVNAEQGFGGDWFLAATSYFGCDPLPGGQPDPNCGDVYSNAAGYYNHLTAYVDTTFGPEVTEALQRGELDEGEGKSPYDDAWKNAGGTHTHEQPAGECGVGDIPCWVRKASDAAVANLFGSIGGVAPRIGIAILGLGIGLIGVKVLSS